MPFSTPELLAIVGAIVFVLFIIILVGGTLYEKGSAPVTSAATPALSDTSTAGGSTAGSDSGSSSGSGGSDSGSSSSSGSDSSSGGSTAGSGSGSGGSSSGSGSGGSSSSSGSGGSTAGSGSGGSSSSSGSGGSSSSSGGSTAGSSSGGSTAGSGGSSVPPSTIPPAQPATATNTSAIPTRVFTIKSGINSIYGLVATAGGTGTGITYAGTTPDAPTCQTACAGDSTCMGYTWVDGTGGAWANGCYKLDQTAKPTATAQASTTSGLVQYNSVVAPAGITYTQSPSTNAVYGRIVSPGWSTLDAHSYGTTPDEPSCANQCSGDPFCQAYTWTDTTGGDWANTCYGIDSTYTLTPQTGHYAGVKKPATS